ncbi:SDR family oxidoreductase [Leucobacter luti]|uniref:Sorbose reductase n=1 Tax=Leucobacter luti TaxID=340320 RepID=A0A4Q7U3U1_9MICO|nr:SDR family oxidoreductase [Leucobacter luti]MBL3699332.1 SDR family oxidoreductase [Leucobacter luti]RZT66842.1 sorbose reductase [Leucobacter luti]
MTEVSLTGPAVVTGGARGLGYSLAQALAAQGSAVALLDILPDVADSAARITAEYGVRAIGLVVDVTDQDAVASAFTQIAAEIGTPQILLTAAGITVWNDSVDVSAAEWRRVMSVNLDGTFFAAQAFGRGLLAAGLPGSAVFVASMSGSIVNVPQFQASYNASKAAVAHLGKSLAVEWAAAGIRVNSISPGYFLSDMTAQFTEQNPELAREWVSRIPVGRMGQPGDLHGLVTFLASDASSYLTGQDLVIDGGYTAI